MVVLGAAVVVQVHHLDALTQYFGQLTRVMAGEQSVAAVQAGAVVGAVHIVQGVDHIAQIFGLGAVVGHLFSCDRVCQTQIFDAGHDPGVLQGRKQRAEVVQGGLPRPLLLLAEAEIRVDHRVDHREGDLHISGGVDGADAFSKIFNGRA